jgi:hypothetical protein
VDAEGRLVEGAMYRARSRKDRIEATKAGRFQLVPGDAEFIPLPRDWPLVGRWRRARRHNQLGQLIQPRELYRTSMPLDRK